MQEEGSSTKSETVSKKRRPKLTDVLLLVGFLVIIALLTTTLLNQLSLRHEVNGARVTTDKLIATMQKQDGASARKLGDPSFQAQHTSPQLNGLFAQSKTYTIGTPTVVKQTVNNGSAAHVVSIFYKFNDKKPFYVRVTVSEPNSTDSW